jgi:hypothetical protein
VKVVKVVPKTPYGDFKKNSQREVLEKTFTTFTSSKNRRKNVRKRIRKVPC